MTNANNNLVYILNGANMGSFIINSLVNSDQISITYSINLNSIPLNLNDNVLCVLSLTVPTYNISRTFLTTMNNNIGNFTSSDNKTFIINTQSLSSNANTGTSSSYNQSQSLTQVDDTLFLYIIVTNKSFNVILNQTTIHTISNITLLPQSNATSIYLSGKAPPLKFSDNSSYTFYISTENSSTVSNIRFNNTLIQPLNYSDIDLTVLNPKTLNGTPADMSSTPSNSLEITPVSISQTLKLNRNNLNSSTNNETPVNQCVILNIINPKFHNLSGYFSFELTSTLSNIFTPSSVSSIYSPSSSISLYNSPSLTTTENFTNGPSSTSIVAETSTIINNQIKSQPSNNSIFSSLSNLGATVTNATAALSKNTYDTVLSTTGLPHDSVMNVTSTINTVSKTSLDSLSYAYKVARVNTLQKTKPDNINNVPILIGLPCSLNVSYYDINNNQINFIASNIIIYLSSGLNTIIYSVLNATNSIETPNENSILSFNGEINSVELPDYIKNGPYVLSTGPIPPYVTYSLTSSPEYNTEIKNGSFSLASQNNKLIISNIDTNGINSIPFISLLYTIVNTKITLNILNLDYSVACSLIITGVALSQKESTISYSILSGNMPQSQTNYIFSLLQTSDIILSVNNSKLYNDILTKNNNLILGIQNSIGNSYINNPEDLNIQQALIIITNAASQSTILLTTPFINTNSTTLQIANATITMAFNAINYAMLGDPTNSELQYFYSILTQLTNPIIVTTILNNTLNHINKVISENQNSPNLPAFKNAKNAVNSALDQINVPSALDSPTLNTPSSVYIPIIKNALEAVNAALVVEPDLTDLLKAQSNLLTIEPISLGTYKVENMSDSSGTDSSAPTTTAIIIGVCCCLIIMGGIAFAINSYLSQDDKKFFSSESSSSDSTGDSSSSL
jgi:hypothetical protein